VDQRSREVEKHRSRGAEEQRSRGGRSGRLAEHREGDRPNNKKIVVDVCSSQKRPKFCRGECKENTCHCPEDARLIERECVGMSIGRERERERERDRERRKTTRDEKCRDGAKL
jgi:hypothetical protein